MDKAWPAERSQSLCFMGECLEALGRVERGKGGLSSRVHTGSDAPRAAAAAGHDLLPIGASSRSRRSVRASRWPFRTPARIRNWRRTTRGSRTRSCTGACFGWAGRTRRGRIGKHTGPWRLKTVGPGSMRGCFRLPAWRRARHRLQGLPGVDRYEQEPDSHRDDKPTNEQVLLVRARMRGWPSPRWLCRTPNRAASPVNPRGYPDREARADSHFRPRNRVGLGARVAAGHGAMRRRLPRQRHRSDR